MKTGLVYHNDYLKHRQEREHPENPERLAATLEYFIKTRLLDAVEQITPEPATVEDITRVHTHEHVDYIHSRCEEGSGRFAVIDPDTYICDETYNVALLSAGGDIAAGEAVWTGKIDNCFALVRPPGHHASRNQATGFCYFDNITVMTRYLQANHDVKKVFIFDWDAHAPNGTMGNLYGDPTVLNMSIHQDPRSFYPGVGFMEQFGEGPGRGYTVNFPVPAGTGDADYLYFIEEFVIPRVRKFKPDLIAVAAGQDSHTSDLISQLEVTDAGYAAMTRMFMDLSDELCGGKLVLELEGGYNTNTLPITHHTIVSTLAGIPYEKEVTGEASETTKNLLNQLNETLKSASIIPDAPEYGEAEK